MKRLVALLGMAVGVWACSSSKNPAPAVPVAGSRADVSALVGRWEGEYNSEATGRSGSIVFELKPGDRVARGDVLMIPKGGLGAGTAGTQSSLPGTSESLRTMPQVLKISFVSTSGDVLTGTIDPYQDPECNCEVRTTFVGKLSGDTVEGTFTTNPSGSAPLTTGRWKITRKKSEVR
jgi:hypothetical protein